MNGEIHINDQDRKVAALLTEWGIKYNAVTRERSRIEDDSQWGEHDSWIVSFGAVSFNYNTGIGHRMYSKSGGVGLGSERAGQLKELLELTGADKRLAVKEAGHIYLRRTMASATITYTVPPTQASVLYSLLLGSTAASMSFDEWAGDYGFDTDSRKAMDIYLEGQKVYNKLLKVFHYNQLEELREVLQEY